MEPAWLDTIVATPLIGVRPAFAWQTAAKYANGITPYLQLLNENGFSFKVASTGVWAVQIDLDEEGIIIKVTPDTISAECSNVFRDTRGPGERPSFVPVSNDPYTVRLEACRAQLLSLLHQLHAVAPVQLSRIGVVAHCRLSERTVPPGLANLIKHLDAPWRSPLRNMECLMLASLGEHDRYLDQCHHRVSLDRTAKIREVDVMLDWQRATSGVPLSDDGGFEASLDACLATAQRYFEQVGDGGYIDVDI